jgi:hypothetical protein
MLKINFLKTFLFFNSNFIIFCISISIFSNFTFADETSKLLIPNESFRSVEQKEREVENFAISGLSKREWRKRKCYRNMVFNIFYYSKLCPTDPQMCRHSYTVEELHLYKRYWDYLLQISELCADGYVLSNADRSFFTHSSQPQVDAFIEHVKKTRKKIINYDDPPSKIIFNSNAKDSQKIKESSQGAHGAISPPSTREIIDKNELKIKEQQLLDEERKIAEKKKILLEEKKLIEQKKKLNELSEKIREAEELLETQKKELNF